MSVEPYVFFEGRCDEAIEFYKSALDAKVEMLMRYKDSPTPPSHLPPGGMDKIMHARIKIADQYLLVSDGHVSGKPDFAGFGISLTLPSAADTQRFFNNLSNGGQVRLSLTKTFFTESFGMVVDKFGVLWMVMVEH
jgi:PhnB protein